MSGYVVGIGVALVAYGALQAYKHQQEENKSTVTGIQYKLSKSSQEALNELSGLLDRARVGNCLLVAFDSEPSPTFFVTVNWTTLSKDTTEKADILVNKAKVSLRGAFHIANDQRRQYLCQPDSDDYKMWSVMSKKLYMFADNATKNLINTTNDPMTCGDNLIDDSNFYKNP